MSGGETSRLSRKAFIKRLATGAAAGLLVGAIGGRSKTAQASESGRTITWGMLIDLTRCVGCDSCARACKESNQLSGSGTRPIRLDPETYTFVDPVQVVLHDGRTVTRHVKRQCMHCLNAACVSACPAAAMYNSDEGPIVYRANRCLGCRYCEVGCPFGIPRFNWNDGLTPTINKCWMCFDRLQAGQQPACAEACPSGALFFGNRPELLAKAHALIETNPDRYINHVFGEHEVGGTSMLYLSDVPFDALGFPRDLPRTAPSEETEKIMTALPMVIAGMATLMTGTALYTHRDSEKEK